MAKAGFCDFFLGVGKMPQGACKGGMVEGMGWLLQVGGVPAWQGGQVMVGQDQDDGFVGEG